ncbi:MAG TPA: DUF5777 family beta-barrel protein [Terriglobia bacterium]|nr:DUF5777 family beta-barrel protein [Terriglobia bacterium]
MRPIGRVISKMNCVTAVGYTALILGLAAVIPSARAEDSNLPAANSHAQPTPAAPGVPPETLGISFVEGSSNTLMVEREGKKYLVDLASHSISEVDEAPAEPQTAQETAKSPAGKIKALTEQKQAEAKKNKIYDAGDDYLFSLPTGRRLDRHGFYVNFNHRFAFGPAFSGPALGHTLGGLDNFSLSSLGIRYGVTQDFSVSIYRSPSVIGRPIQLMAAYNFVDEHDGHPLNGAVRFSVDGENDFSKNFTANFEGIFSRSLANKAQLYVVPTLSFQNRRLVPPPNLLVDPVPDLPGVNTFSVGFGGAFDIRPTVAIVAEVIPTFVGYREMDIHRPAYSIGIQKRLWRHAFTFGFTTSPGTTVNQRAGTRASFLNDPTADKPSGLFIGFDLTRQIY